MLSKDQCVYKLLGFLWYISPSIIDSELEEKDSSISKITCLHKDYINIRVRGLESVLNDEELNCAEYLTSRKVKYYKSISYTIVNKNDQLDITLCIGNIVDVLEDVSEDKDDEIRTIVSYIQIQAIFIHTKRQFDILFLLLDWFILLEVDDPKLGCLRYRLQQLADQT
ncbi:223_t:CDS:2 [Funneliformis caledonium]|uniref:223_t:CDS:1 n=1 Tax=Funneliformis caledonium TaxID=1117310 RepID=A0A9N9GQV2_9GLOM|nr:223_t:CDS:2 [Funneliformis caledonium]